MSWPRRHDDLDESIDTLGDTCLEADSRLDASNVTKLRTRFGGFLFCVFERTANGFCWPLTADSNPSLNVRLSHLCRASLDLKRK
ncbi:MAG: hypothetical protein ACI915_000902 [Gammaproteobacteria bacterium]|jgi:hypothetical protein